MSQCCNICELYSNICLNHVWNILAWNVCKENPFSWATIWRTINVPVYLALHLPLTRWETFCKQHFQMLHSQGYLLHFDWNQYCWNQDSSWVSHWQLTVYPKKYAHGFVVLCFVVVMQLFIMNSHEVFIHIHQGCFAGTGAIVRLPQCQWSKPDGYGKTSQCITTTKHSKGKTVCIFLGIYCISVSYKQ